MGHKAEISIDNSSVPNGLWDRDYKRSSPDLGNFKSVQAREKNARNQKFKAAPAKHIINANYITVLIVSHLT